MKRASFQDLTENFSARAQIALEPNENEAIAHLVSGETLKIE